MVVDLYEKQRKTTAFVQMLGNKDNFLDSIEVTPYPALYSGMRLNLPYRTEILSW